MPLVWFARQSCTWAPALTQRYLTWGTNMRAGFPQSQSLSSDESITVATTQAPQELIQWLCWCLQLMTYKDMRKRTCFGLGSFPNFLTCFNRRGGLFRVIPFLSCREDTMYRSPYLLSCREKLPHHLHKNVHFISSKACKIWGKVSNINSSQTLSGSNPECLSNCSAKGPVKSEESSFQ